MSTVRLSWFILLIIVAHTSYGQYKSIAGQNTSWDLKHEIFDAAGMENLVLTDTLTFNNTVYYKTNLNGSLLGYFREDTTSGKAWFWSIYDTTEYLIMDMSLNVNDTFLVKMYSDSLVTIASIDTVDGRKVITLNYHYGGGFISENLKFIEGVGPNASLFYQVDDKYTPFPGGYLFGYLVCKMFQDTSIVYAWDTINFECGPFFLGLQGNFQTDRTIKIFPNPVDENLFILKISSSVPSIRIYNYTGQVVFENAYFRDEKIDTQRFPNGLYFLWYSESNYCFEEKFVVRHSR